MKEKEIEVVESNEEEVENSIPAKILPEWKTKDRKKKPVPQPYPDPNVVHVNAISKSRRGKFSKARIAKGGKPK